MNNNTLTTFLAVCLSMMIRITSDASSPYLLGAEEV